MASYHKFRTNAYICSESLFVVRVETLGTLPWERVSTLFLSPVSPNSSPLRAPGKVSANVLTEHKSPYISRTILKLCTKNDLSYN